MKNVPAENYYAQLLKECHENGYYLNPDNNFVMTLIEGLLTNKDRYGYEGCPCMENTGNRDVDRDIICPCDYRDDDLEEYGTCYCSLFVSEDVVHNKKKVGPIPLRRTKLMDPQIEKENIRGIELQKQYNTKTYPVWRCAVCGYLCARNAPPQKCPVCKAGQDRFQKFAYISGDHA